jgi:hypothetical protein
LYPLNGKAQLNPPPNRRKERERGKEMPRYLIAYTCCEEHGETVLCYLDAETEDEAERLAKESEISSFRLYATEVSERRFNDDYDYLDSLQERSA